MRALRRAEVLALASALLPYPQAEDAWRHLLSEVPWEEFDESLQRCLPVIAINLSPAPHPRGASAVPQGGRLAGFYRSTWTANIVRARGLHAILDAFEAVSLDYRLTKGMAMCALTDQWGSRRMGDADVVVGRRDAAKAVQALRALDYFPRFFRRIDDNSPPRSSCWEGPQGQLVDLHIGDPSRRLPSILDLMLVSPPMHVESQARRWPLPSPAAMAVHAASHARVGASSSDHVQSLVDVSRLLPLVDERELTDLAGATASAGSLGHLLTELSTVTGQDRYTVKPGRAEPISRGARRILGVAIRLPEVLRERSDPAPSVSAANLRGWLYRPWFRAGQVRHLERLVVRSVGGFVLEGGVDLPRDRRRKVVIPLDLRGQPIRIEITCRDSRARLLFIDGRSHGVLERFTAVTVECARPSLEVSARLLGDPPAGETGEMRVEVMSAHAVAASAR